MNWPVVSRSRRFESVRPPKKWVQDRWCHRCALTNSIKSTRLIDPCRPGLGLRSVVLAAVKGAEYRVVTIDGQSGSCFGQMQDPRSRLR